MLSSAEAVRHDVGSDLNISDILFYVPCMGFVIIIKPIVGAPVCKNMLELTKVHTVLIHSRFTRLAAKLEWPCSPLNQI